MSLINSNRLIVFFSIILAVGAVVVIVINGVNPGVDFTGGAGIEFSVPDRYGVEDIKFALHDCEDCILQTSVNAGVYVVNFKAVEGDSRKVDLVKDMLSKGLNDNQFYHKVNYVGPFFSEYMVFAGIRALGLSLLFMFCYLLWRFDVMHAMGGVVSLIYDVLMMTAMFAVTGIEFTVSSVAAVLTVIGYSVNDTVVIYDAVNIDSAFRKLEVTVDLLSYELKKVLRRTVLTSFTTCISVLSLVVFNMQHMGDFVWGILVGIISGVFSSMLIAPQFLLLYRKNKPKDKRSVGCVEIN